MSNALIFDKNKHRRKNLDRGHHTKNYLWQNYSKNLDRDHPMSEVCDFLKKIECQDLEDDIQDLEDDIQVCERREIELQDRIDQLGIETRDLRLLLRNPESFHELKTKQYKVVCQEVNL